MHKYHFYGLMFCIIVISAFKSIINGYGTLEHPVEEGGAVPVTRPVLNLLYCMLLLLRISFHMTGEFTLTNQALLFVTTVVPSYTDYRIKA